MATRLTELPLGPDESVSIRILMEHSGIPADRLEMLADCIHEDVATIARRRVCLLAEYSADTSSPTDFMQAFFSHKPDETISIEFMFKLAFTVDDETLMDFALNDYVALVPHIKHHLGDPSLNSIRDEVVEKLNLPYVQLQARIRGQRPRDLLASTPSSCRLAREAIAAAPDPLTNETTEALLARARRVEGGIFVPFGGTPEIVVPTNDAAASNAGSGFYL